MCRLSVFCRCSVSGTWSVCSSRFCSSAAMYRRDICALTSYCRRLEQESWKVRTFHPSIHHPSINITIHPSINTTIKNLTISILMSHSLTQYPSVLKTVWRREKSGLEFRPVRDPPRANCPVPNFGKADYSLHIAETTFEDGGKYMCVVEGKIRMAINLRVVRGNNQELSLLL